MPLDSPDGRRWPAPLAGRVARDADVGQLAAAVTAVWHDIDGALHPIVGHRGVAALYNRSLKVAMAFYPWLAAADLDVLADLDPSTLHDALVQQSVDEAAAGSIALFVTFRELLASLIGASLTDRLLGAVWAHTTGVPPAQDNSR